MKKFCILLMAIIGICIFTLTGCSNGGTFKAMTYSTEATRIESIDIRVSDRELNIGVAEDNMIRIEYSDSEKEYLEINVSEDNTLCVELMFDKEWTDFIGTKPPKDNRRINIFVPDDMLSEITASTTNETIRLSGISVTDSISLDCNGGDIICERVCTGNAISLKAKNGDITGTIAGSWDDFSIFCTIKKGECNLPLNKENGEKSFVADCNNGDIDVEFVG